MHSGYHLMSVITFLSNKILLNKSKVCPITGPEVREWDYWYGSSH
jgi:hypothetical protein